MNRNSTTDHYERYSPYHVTEYSFLFHWNKIRLVLENFEDIMSGEMNVPHPVTVEVNPIDYCNHDCTWCFTKSHREKDRLPKDILQGILGSLIDGEVTSVHFAGGGESTLYKGLIDSEPNNLLQNQSLIAWLANRGLSIGLITNGSTIDPKKDSDILSNLSWIRFSIDAASEERYEKIHQPTHHSLEDVFLSMQRLVEKRGKKVHPAIGCSFIYEENTDEVAKEIIDFCSRCASIGVDFIQIKPENANRGELATTFIDRIKPRILHELKESTTFALINLPHTSENSDFCWYSFFGPVVGATGEIYTCCYTYGQEDFSYGQVNTKDSFDDVWSSKHRLNTVSKIQPRNCTTCRHNSFNLIVEKIMASSRNSLDEISRVLAQLDNDTPLEKMEIPSDIQWLLDGFQEYESIHKKGFNKMLDFPVYRPTQKI